MQLSFQYRTMIFVAFIVFALLAHVECGYSGKCDGNKLLDTMQHMMKCKGHVFVGFDAVLNTKLTGVKAGHVINFDGVLTNIGNGYKDGVFTCPVPGVYHFTWAILTDPGKDGTTYIMLNGSFKRVSYTRDNTGKQYYTSTMSILLHLDKGDRVWVKVANNNGYIHSSYSFFSSMLMKSD